MNNGIVDSVLKSNPVHVNTSDIKTPVTEWACRVKSKVWQNENGLIIENNSSMTHGKPVRRFFIFKNQEDYDAGRVAAESVNLGKAKLSAESL